MKKNMLVTIVVIVTILLSMTLVYANKYERLIPKQEWTNVDNKWKKTIGSSFALKNYADLFVSEKEIVSLSKTGKYTTDQKTFIMNHSKGLYQMTQLLVGQQLNKINKEQTVTEASLMYISGVIKSPKAVAAKTGQEYEMELMVLREIKVYELWERWKRENYTKMFINSFIDQLDKKK